MSQVLNPAASLPLADSPELQQALAEANLPTLLAVYVHLSHDAAMLDRFADCIRPAFAPVPTPQKQGSQNRVRFWYPIVSDEPKPRWKPMMSALDLAMVSGNESSRQSTSIQKTFLFGKRSQTE